MIASFLRIFITLERSLQYKGRIQDFNEAITEYLMSGHAEEVPVEDLSKSPSKVFYLPMRTWCSRSPVQLSHFLMPRLEAPHVCP